MIAMVQTMKKKEKTAKDYKSEIKKLKKTVKGHKIFEDKLHSKIEDTNVKITQLL